MPITSRAFAAGVILSALLTVSTPVRGDEPPTLGSPFLIQAWTTDDGLPQSSIFTLAQTGDGYLWMGTGNGLVRFDGMNFTVFDESNTPELASGPIIYLFADSRSDLWVGTKTAGILLIRAGQVIPLKIGEGSHELHLVSATEDEDGTVWLYTAEGALCRYLSGRMDTWTLDPRQYGSTRSIIAEKGGLVWAATETRQFGIGDPDTNTLSQLPLIRTLPVEKLDFLLASRAGGYWRMANGRVEKWKGTARVKDLGQYLWGDSRIAAAVEDPQGNLVVATLGSGVYWYDSEDRARKIPGLSYEWIFSLCFDREGDLWVGTDGRGLNRVKQSRFQTLPGTEDWVVQSVSADAEGGLWIGCNGGELAYWSDGTLTPYDIPYQPRPSIKSVAVDEQQRVWVGTWDAGLFRLEGDLFKAVETEGLSQTTVVAIYEDPSQTLWLGMQEGFARLDESAPQMFTAAPSLTNIAVRALARDAGGSLWIGTAGGGLNRLRDGQLTAYHKTPDQLPSDDINALLVDADDVLWIATAGGGLVRFDHGHWHTFSKHDGLPSNSIGYLLEDGEGFLWLGSNAGLLRASKSELNACALAETTSISFRAYGKPAGLPTRECTFGSQPAACATSDDRLWFPTIKGLVTVDSSALQPNPVPPPVSIESIRIDQVEKLTNTLSTSWPARVTLVPGNQLLEVSYTSLNLGTRDQTRFRYRLEGHDPAWIDAGSDQTARYPQLPPGDYTFRVTAANEDGLWNPTGATFAVSVLPPFWRTAWFIVISVGTLLLMIAGSVYYVSTQRLQRQLALLRQQEALERERARIARDLHDQLGANLTQLSLLGELVEADKATPEEVEEHAKQLCHTARETTHALDEIVWAANPSNDTLEGLINYVCKYAQEYFALAGLRYRLEVPSPLPAMTLQPELRHNVFLAAKEAVNNIVKHAQASEARVALKLNESNFTLEIADNGRGPSGTDTKAAKSRSGLRNMRKRMDDVGGTFLIDPIHGGGSIVRLTVPLKKR